MTDFGDALNVLMGLDWIIFTVGTYIVMLGRIYWCGNGFSIPIILTKNVHCNLLSNTIFFRFGFFPLRQIANLLLKKAGKNAI